MCSNQNKTAGNGRPTPRKGALLRAVVRWVKIKLTYSQLYPGGYLFLKSKIESVHMAYTVNLSESGSPFQLKLSLCSFSTQCPQAEVWQWAGFPFWHMECVTFSTCLGGKLPGVYRFAFGAPSKGITVWAGLLTKLVREFWSSFIASGFNCFTGSNISPHF